MLVKSAELTRGEKLVIQRRRNGYTVAQAAKKLKATLAEYRGWERDEGKVPAVSIGKVPEHELCYVMRRRSGQTLAEVAAKIKCCRWWLHQMEGGDAPVAQLKEFWERRKK